MDAELQALLDESPQGDVATAVFVPPEELLDREDPANDRFFRSLYNQRAHINTLSRKLPPRNVQVARLHVQGMRGKEIATKLNYAQTTISAILQKPRVQNLVDLLRRANALIEGPNLAVRKNLLWRIAANNEHNEPAVTLAAIRELNKIDGAYQEKINAPTQVTVIINQDLLPKTQLDAHDDG
ncbi:unnamed protein product [marine sediment metagenome]|uniref:HTH luxR-type domain-containing protein n=1 Tax=marine sediment metagenome TaxID=412755 RepID=X0SKE4_9ZZZZ